VQATNSAAKTGSLRLPILCWCHNFGSVSYFVAANMFCDSKCYFVADNSISAACHKFAANNTTLAANHNFAVEHTIRQRITNLLQNTQFGSECQFAANNLVSAANHKFVVDNSSSATNPKFAAKHTFWQRMLICCNQLSFNSESQIPCRQLNFGNQSQICCRTHDSAVNHKFAAEHTIRQRMLIRCRQLSLGSESQIRCRQLNFGSESQIHYKIHISA
jgi:hypothetical protein